MHRMFWLSFALALPAFTQGPFAWKDSGSGQMELLEGSRPALVYNYGPQLKAGAPENRRRCCYVFPLYTPAGVSLLDDFPKDHYHHRGLFWSWPIVEVGGKEYDIWMNFTARHRSANIPTVSVDPKQASLEAQNFWEADGKDIVREQLRLTVSPTEELARVLDIELTWEALGATVTLQGSAEQGKSYGGLSARFAPRTNTILRSDGDILKKDEDLILHQWAELEADYGGKRALMRITPSFMNPGFPYQWCLRSYGFIGASFPGRTATLDRYPLQPGKPLTLRFQVRVADLR